MHNTMPHVANGPYQPYYGAAGQMLMQQPMMHNLAEKIHMEAPKPISVPAYLATIAVPSLLFAIVLWARAMWLRQFYPWLSLGLALYFLIFVLVVGVMTWSAMKDPKQGNPRLLGLVFFLCAFAWVGAFVQGDSIYTRFTSAYYDIDSLASYPSVDPTKSTGTDLMDAGVVEFTPESKLDLTKTIGFKDGTIYCVAPIVVPGQDMAHYDFWAVGTNCCGSHPIDNAHGPTYKCGEYNIPHVHKGIRIMDDSKRNFYRLAVKEAEATYNIDSSHPVFLHWMADPSAELLALQDDAWKFFLFNVVGCCLIVKLIVTGHGLVSSLFSK